MNLQQAIGSVALAVPLACIGVALAIGPASALDFEIQRGLFAVAAISAVGGAIWLFWGTSSRVHYRATASVIAPVLIGAALWVAWGWSIQRELRTVTTLYPGTQPTPKLPGCSPPKGALVIVAGGGLAWSTRDTTTLIALIHGSTFEPLFEVQKGSDGTLVISKLLILDRNDTAVVQKDADTDFWIRDGYRWHKPDRSTLIVNGTDGRAILRVALLNKNAAGLSADMYDHKGREFKILKDKIVLPDNNTISAMCSGNNMTTIGIGE